MKHRRYFLALFALLLFEFNYAQRMQAKFQLGYGVPLVNTPQWTLLSNNSYTVQSFSFGSGLRAEAGVVRQLKKNLSIQLDAAYLSGKKNSLHQVSGTSFSNAVYYSKFYDVSPLIRFTMEESKIKPYIAVGPIFGFGKFYRDLESGTSGSTNVVTSSREYKGSYAFGTKSELGVQLQRGKINYYAQLTVITMRYSPTSSELTSYVVYSSNQLSSLTTAQKQTVYVNSVPSTTTTPNPSQPSQSLKSSYVFDSVSLNVGMMFTL
jgi:hypothetical protein